jgi:hypothetical protein
MINEAKNGSFVPFNDVDALTMEILKYKNLTKEKLFEIGSRGKIYLIENHIFSKLSLEYESLFSNS